MKSIITIATLISTVIIYSQNEFKSKLSLDFGYSFNEYKLTSLNENLIDNYINELERLNDRITTGRSFILGIGFSSNRFIENRIHLCYERGISENIALINTIFDGQVVEVPGQFIARARALSVSLGTQFYLNQLNFLKPKAEKSFIHRFQYGPEFNIGYGFGNFIMHSAIPSENIYGEFLFRANGLKYQFGLKSEFTFKVNSVVSSLGFIFGYQYFKTSELKRFSGDNLIGFGESTPNLDFSGFYYGIYLKLGK